MKQVIRLRTIGLIALLLTLIAAFGTRNFHWNVSALLHVDQTFGETYKVPSDIVLYKDGGYDGMSYYQIARELPQLFLGDAPGNPPFYGNAYRSQRILLPFLAYILSFGREAWLPHIILIINIASVCGALALVLRMSKRLNVHVLTIAFNPAALVGILFSLTEPLSLLFITLFLYLWEKNKHKLDMAQISALALATLARETTIFLIGLIFIYELFRNKWRDSGLILLSVVPFIIWEIFLILRLKEISLLTGSGMFSLPFEGPIILFHNITLGLDVYSLSALSLLFLFIIPLFIHEISESLSGNKNNPLLFILFGLTVIMLSLDAHIWGVITSVGRVITPLYPVYALVAIKNDTGIFRALSTMLIVISVITALGISAVPHPFTIS